MGSLFHTIHPRFAVKISVQLKF